MIGEVLEEHALVNKVLADFVAEPLAYDVSERLSEEEIIELTAECEELRKELYGNVGA